MATRILYEFISERRMTITDSIERCLKKGTVWRQGGFRSFSFIGRFVRLPHPWCGGIETSGVEM